MPIVFPDNPTVGQIYTNNGRSWTYNGRFWFPGVAVGSTGATGATGIQGNVSITGATGLGFTWRGTWSNLVSYYINDVVSFGGASYVALTLHTNSQPPSANWAVVASQGATGLTGATGAPGAYCRVSNGSNQPKVVVRNERSSF